MKYLNQSHLKTFLIYILIYSILFILIELVAHISILFGFILFFMLFIISTGFLLSNINNLILEDPVLIDGIRLSEKKDRNVRIIMIYVLVIWSNLFFYTEMSRYSNILFHTFSTSDNSFSKWLLYTLKILYNSLLLNAPEYFNWINYSIFPMKIFSKIFQYLFHLSIEILLISKIYELFRFLKKKKVLDIDSNNAKS